MTDLDMENEKENEPRLDPWREFLKTIECMDVQDHGSVILVRFLSERMEFTTMTGLARDGRIGKVLIYPLRVPAADQERMQAFVAPLNREDEVLGIEVSETDGMIRLELALDVPDDKLEPVIYEGMFDYLRLAAEKLLPYVTGVLYGHLEPSFAADQAEAALQEALGD